MEDDDYNAIAEDEAVEASQQGRIDARECKDSSDEDYILGTAEHSAYITSYNQQVRQNELEVKRRSSEIVCRYWRGHARDALEKTNGDNS